VTRSLAEALPQFAELVERAELVAAIAILGATWWADPRHPLPVQAAARAMAPVSLVNLLGGRRRAATSRSSPSLCPCPGTGGRDRPGSLDRVGHLRRRLRRRVFPSVVADVRRSNSALRWHNGPAGADHDAADKGSGRLCRQSPIEGSAVGRVDNPQVFRQAVRVEARRRGLRVRTGIADRDPNVVRACDPDWRRRTRITRERADVR